MPHEISYRGSRIALIYKRIFLRQSLIGGLTCRLVRHLPTSASSSHVQKGPPRSLGRFPLAGIISTNYNPALRQIASSGRESSCATSSSLACRCAPDSRSSRTCSDKPALTAKKSGVWPALFRRCTEAPCKRSILKISMLGLVAARCYDFG